MTSRSGQSLVLMAGVMLGLVALAGLAVDGNQLFQHRRALQNLADRAARAGAMEIDRPRFRQTGELVLDPLRARAQVAAALAPEGATPPGPVLTATTVTVTVSRPVETAFIRIVGIRSVTVSATATGEACPTAVC
ncbi:MAG: Tad domain-containing protein [Chloroflexi bacterium]|nr:Tad domain-containing protein [Chloroflexota bacterium]